MAPVSPALFSRKLAASGAPSIADERFSRHLDLKGDQLAVYRQQFSMPNCKSIGSGIKHKGTFPLFF
jgi:hypothetical protein